MIDDIYKIATTKSFRKSFDIIEFNNVIELLRTNKNIPLKYKDHSLTGNMRGLRDIHISPDIILLYTKINKILILELVNIGSHSEIF